MKACRMILLDDFRNVKRYERTLFTMKLLRKEKLLLQDSLPEGVKKKILLKTLKSFPYSFFRPFSISGWRSRPMLNARISIQSSHEFNRNPPSSLKKLSSQHLLYLTFDDVTDEPKKSEWFDRICVFQWHTGKRYPAFCRRRINASADTLHRRDFLFRGNRRGVELGF